MNRILIAMVLLAAGCSRQTMPTEPSRGFWITGRVLDFTTNAGVTGATVIFGQMTFPNGAVGVPSMATTTMTDAAGGYTLVLSTGHYDVWVGDGWLGTTEVTGPAYRGNLFVNSGTCVARYGIVADGRTQQPIPGVTVALVDRTTTTDRDGWYRIDLGCPDNGLYGFNTSSISFQHPNYAIGFQTVGRGVSGVRRLDYLLLRQ